MPRLRGLHPVQLAIPPGSEDRCRHFWSTILGCAEVEKPPDLVGRGGRWFRAGHSKSTSASSGTSERTQRLTRESKSKASESWRDISRTRECRSSGTNASPASSGSTAAILSVTASSSWKPASAQLDVVPAADRGSVEATRLAVRRSLSEVATDLGHLLVRVRAPQHHPLPDAELRRAARRPLV
jgi:hypothetical protein